MAPAPKGRGWTDIGYHMVIETCGGEFRGRPDDRLGAHVEGNNQGNLGVCLIGDTKFTKKQFEWLRHTLDTWFGAYNITPVDLYCHYEWESAKKQGKTCPNVPRYAIHDWYFNTNEDSINPYILGA
jgi:N-acetylmuramoyl-L-alanine amidase